MIVFSLSFSLSPDRDHKMDETILTGLSRRWCGKAKVGVNKIEVE